MVKEGAKIIQLIQVCWDVSDQQTRKRETQNQLKASAELDCNDLLVISEEYESNDKASWMSIERQIRFVSLWRWLIK